MSVGISSPSPDIHLEIKRALSKNFLKVWCHEPDRLPGEPVAVPKHPLGEEPFPDIQPDPPLLKLHAIPLGPITANQREEIRLL